MDSPRQRCHPAAPQQVSQHPPKPPCDTGAEHGWAWLGRGRGACRWRGPTGRVTHRLDHLLDCVDDQIVAGAEHLAVDLIQLADVFLLGTVIYLVGLGLHLLFVNPQLPDQPWIAVSDLDDLKEMLVRVIVLLIGVTFLGSFVEQADDVPVLELGMTTAVVVAAFTLVILVAKLPDWSRAEGERHARSDREASAPTDIP